MRVLLMLLVAAVLFLASASPAPAAGRAPNIVVILSDDAGYADFSMHGSRRFLTPNIDSIAENGVLFTQGYVTASVCSPSRAGLLTGRYPQRFGHEFNIPPRWSETNGLPLTEVPLSAVLKPHGYRTIALGKWHLGYADAFHPLSRGFDDFFGFLQGARSYRPLRGNRLNRLLRDRNPIDEDFEYMTDELGKRAAAYIARHRDRPFFLYLAPNAVHTPMHARPDDLEAVAEIRRPRRRTLAAMTLALDRMVGTVLAALRRHDLDRDTLLFFINDNGGATRNASVNAPLRGHKATPFEGGLRVPFVAQWPARLPRGKRYEHPVITLDVFPTALAAAGYPGEPKNALDGVNLLPFLTGRKQSRPHPSLYWRRGPNWAVRHLDFKLVFHRRTAEAPMLFDLGNDPYEEHDLAGEHPDRVASLKKRYDAWASELADPRWRYGRGRKRKPPSGKRR